MSRRDVVIGLVTVAIAFAAGWLAHGWWML